MFPIFKPRTNKTAPRTGVLVVSPDDRFFSSVLYLTDRKGWRLQWARSVEGAKDLLTRHLAPIVVYDWRAGVTGWEIGLFSLATHNCQPTVIMAVDHLDEALWRQALEYGAYDVVSRNKDRNQFLVTLRFALDRRNRQTASKAADGRLVAAHPVFLGSECKWSRE